MEGGGLEGLVNHHSVVIDLQTVKHMGGLDRLDKHEIFLKT
jgi:hypothetical protein